MASSRAAIALSLLVLVPIGFYTKVYRGPAAGWINGSLGGAFYEIFWCLAVAFVAPRCRAAAIAAGVFIATCGLEFLQLWHPRLLEAARATFVGAAVLGSYFDPSDFLGYAAGSAAGYLWLRAVIQSPRKEVPWTRP